MKSRIFAFIFLCSPLFSMGQSAQEIIQQFKEFVATTKQYTTQFSYDLSIPQENVTIKEEGKSWVKDKYAKLELKSHTIFLDQQTRWTYTASTEEVVITKIGTSPEDVLADPNQLIIRYLKNSNAKLVTKDTNGVSNQFYQVLLTPKESKSPFKQIILILNKQSFAPAKIHYTGKDGSQMRVNFIKFNPIVGPFALQEVVFNPNKYKQADIIDMR